MGIRGRDSIFTLSEPFLMRARVSPHRTVIVRYFGKWCLATPRNLIFLLDKAKFGCMLFVELRR